MPPKVPPAQPQAASGGTEDRAEPQAVPTRVHVAHRGLFVVAVNVQHLLVRGLGLELLHLLSGLLERGLEGGRRPQGGAGVSTRMLLPPNTGKRSVPGLHRPPGSPQAAPRRSPYLRHGDKPGSIPTPPASAAPPPPLGRFTPHQRAGWPIPAPRAIRRQSAPAGGGEKPGKGPIRGRRGGGGLRRVVARRPLA